MENFKHTEELAKVADNPTTFDKLMLNHSSEINKLALALSKAQGEFPIISKSSKVDFTFKGTRTKYSYADLSLFIEAIKKPMAKFELSVIQNARTLNHGIAVTTMVMHSSGQWIKSSNFVIKPADNKPQSAGSAATYARRYSLTAMLNLASSDDDADAQEISDRDPIMPFTANREQMEMLTAIFNKYEIHKENRMALTDYFIEKALPADPMILEDAVKKSAEKSKGNSE